LTDEDFSSLSLAIDRDPRWGSQGGSSAVPSPAEREAHETAHRFFNYQIRTWIDRMQRGTQ
jgi:hypothetical protein